MSENWDTVGYHVISVVEELKTDVKKLREDVAQLKVKSGMWGAIGGTIPVAVMLIFWLIRQ
jgi:hypothetical protein